MSKFDKFANASSSRSRASSAELQADAIYNPPSERPSTPIFVPEPPAKPRAINIFKIAPDPAQPRRVFPYEVRPHRIYRADDVRAIFEYWFSLYEERTGAPLDTSQYFASVPAVDDEHEGVETVGIEDTLEKLVKLAASIYWRKLTYPITVGSVVNDEHKIETGERRWLAYHLLNILYPGDAPESARWLSIPAVVQAETSVWRQAEENTARDPLNAIAQARQFAILLMDLYSQEGVSFSSYEDCTSDRTYYAQVEDSDQFVIPRGSGPKILAAMNLNNAVRLRQLRALLRLPDQAWQLADDYNISGHKLRAATVETLTDEEKVALVEKMVDQVDDSVTMVTPQSDSRKAPKQAKPSGNDFAVVWERAAQKRIKEAEAYQPDQLAARIAVAEKELEAYRELMRRKGSQ